jgi:AcrR family transcriptional regulator
MARRPADSEAIKSDGANGARERIVAAVMREVIDGDGDFEIADVARRAGVSVGLAYHYYGSKAGLMAVLITDFHDRYQTIVDNAVDKSLPWPIREKARLKASVDFLYADPATHLIMGKLRSSAEVIAIDTGRRAQTIELAARNIANGQKQGYISRKIDPGVAGAAIVGGINQAVAHALSSRKRPSARELTEKLWTFITGGVLLTLQATPNIPRPPSARRKRRPADANRTPRSRSA